MRAAAAVYAYPAYGAARYAHTLFFILGGRPSPGHPRYPQHSSCSIDQL